MDVENKHTRHIRHFTRSLTGTSYDWLSFISYSHGSYIFVELILATCTHTCLLERDTWRLKFLTNGNTLSNSIQYICLKKNLTCLKLIWSAEGTSVSLCACERVTSDFQGIARVEKLRSSKKKKLWLEVRFIIRLTRLKKKFNARDKKRPRAR